MANQKTHIKGVLYCVLSYFTWGLFPLYWKLIQDVSSLEILAHRIFWSFVFMYVLYNIWRQPPLCHFFKDKKQILKLGLCGFLICINWGLYIWAVNNRHIVDASLGYYINPLFNVILGISFFHEKLNKLQIIAIIFAFIGVVYFAINHGIVPWISLALGLSFALYASIKKTLSINAMQGLTIETFLVMPIALGYLIFLFFRSENAIFTISPLTTFLLITAGIVTALPLLWFGAGATKIPLSTVGFLQYISPSLQLIVGVFIFDEPFLSNQIVCFIFIWMGLSIYSFDMFWSMKRLSKIEH